MASHFRAWGRRSAGALSASEVDRRGALRRASAHCNPSPHVYIARGPNFRKGGPPPREAIVASVLALVGKPASVSASARRSRVKSASRLSGIHVMLRPSHWRAKSRNCDGSVQLIRRVCSPPFRGRKALARAGVMTPSYGLCRPSGLSGPRQRSPGSQRFQPVGLQKAVW